MGIEPGMVIFQHMHYVIGISAYSLASKNTTFIVRTAFPPGSQVELGSESFLRCLYSFPRSMLHVNFNTSHINHRFVLEPILRTHKVLICIVLLLLQSIRRGPQSDNRILFLFHIFICIIVSSELRLLGSIILCTITSAIIFLENLLRKRVSL